MAYGTVEVLHAMEADSGVQAAQLAIDGGASQNDWLAQFQADVLGLPVQRPQLVETTALGAAGLAGLAGGVWSSVEQFLGARAAPARFEPVMEDAERQTLLHGWQRAVGAALHWAEHR
jgi:glycerol kinase